MGNGNSGIPLPRWQNCWILAPLLQTLGAGIHESCSPGLHKMLFEMIETLKEFCRLHQHVKKYCFLTTEFAAISSTVTLTSACPSNMCLSPHTINSPPFIIESAYRPIHGPTIYQVASLNPTNVYTLVVHFNF